jgi:glycosyltransferase involved in cell wall biosynthesis
MSSVPRVSVVLAVYNTEHYVREAIDSILGQTFEDFEFIIVNDGSTDGTTDILTSYEDPRIVLLHNERNVGVTRALNRGLARARGEYIARMDPDDISMPRRLEKQVSFLDTHPRVGLLGSRICVLQQRTGRTYTFDNPPTNAQCQWYLLLDNPIAHPAAMMRREVLERAGGRYDERLPSAIDHELFSRMALLCELANLSEPLLTWRAAEKQELPSRRAELLACAWPTYVANIERVAGKGRFQEDDILLMRALWLREIGRISLEDIEATIGNLRSLLDDFSQYYVRAWPGEVQRKALAQARRWVLGCIFLNAALVSCWGKDCRLTRRYLPQAIVYWPGNIKRFHLFLICVVRAWLGWGNKAAE